MLLSMLKVVAYCFFHQIDESLTTTVDGIIVKYGNSSERDSGSKIMDNVQHFVSLTSVLLQVKDASIISVSFLAHRQSAAAETALLTG